MLVPVSRSDPIEVSSHLAASADDVWSRISSLRGVNDELRPLLRMTIPRGVEQLDSDQVIVGERIGRSWLLLFGLIPIDFDDLTLVALEPGRGFEERSRMLSMRVWEHERRLQPPRRGGCVVTDRLRFEPRLPATRRLLYRVVRTTFEHRHRRLRARFGAGAFPRPND